MAEGLILKALSGFYYVDDGQRIITCKPRGKFRHEKITPLVGDHVTFTLLEDGAGSIDTILPRKNQFQRPAVANIDQMVIIASEAVPVTAPFLIDRMICIAERQHCEPIVCINKCDLEAAEGLYHIYASSGFQTLRVSAETGEGVKPLLDLIRGKVSAFTGNSGVGKSSLLNALETGLALQVGEVSDKLGRGRHTTRHVELLRLSCGAVVADTPGFSSFDPEQMNQWRKEELALYFREFAPYREQCRFTGCAHIKEADCAVLQALSEGKIQPSRHESYAALYEHAKSIQDWQRKEK